MRSKFANVSALLLASLSIAQQGVHSQYIDFQPLELVSVNGKLNVTLNVGLVNSLEGIEWSDTGYRTGPGYNGAPLGPTLRVKPGDIVHVTLNNWLQPSPAIDHELFEYAIDPASDDANVTIIYNRLSAIGNIGDPEYGFWGFNFANLHFHGMDFSPKTENLLYHIDGGESRTMTFKVPEDKEPGLHWYHNHVHGTATYSFLSSLFGMIIVEGTASDLTKTKGLENAKEVLMMLSDGLVNPDGTVPPSFPVFGQFNWTGVTNGNMGEKTVFNVHQGTTILFRAASATAESILRLSIPNITFVVLAYDGLILAEPEVTDVVLIPGGGRAEFAARFDQPGTYVMSRAPWAPVFNSPEACAAAGFPFYPCWSFDKEQVAATIVVTPDKDYTAPKPPLVETIDLPDQPQRLVSLANVNPSKIRQFVLKVSFTFPIFQIPYDGPFVPPGVGFGINSRLLTPNYFEGEIAAGSCETWEVLSDPPNDEHTFHIHQAHFLVLAQDGVPIEKPAWHDSLMIRQNATLHVCFDRAEPDDTILAHCHAVNHFDIGMGTMYKAIAPVTGSISGLTLVRADIDAKVTELTNGTTVAVRNISNMPSPDFNLNASYTGNVQSVSYWYNGTKYHTENISPFSFCGNKQNDFFSCKKLGCGTHTVVAVPYSQRNAQGDTGKPHTVTFTIDCTPSTLPTNDITSLELINVKTGTKIVDLVNGTIVYLNDIPGMLTPYFNIKATHEESVKSVVYSYNGTKYSTESISPFAFCGNRFTTFNKCDKIGCGQHTITAVPYTKMFALGSAGQPTTVTFAIDCSS